MKENRALLEESEIGVIFSPRVIGICQHIHSYTYVLYEPNVLQGFMEVLIRLGRDRRGVS